MINMEWIIFHAGEHFMQSVETAGKRVMSNEWIKCSDSMPEKDGRYIVASHGSWVHVEICSLRHGKWDITRISHWMPLPNPPEVSGERP
jgi:Protein of unknown function (DUF551)